MKESRQKLPRGVVQSQVFQISRDLRGEGEKLDI
jgi:hypothetical protein